MLKIKTVIAGQPVIIPLIMALLTFGTTDLFYGHTIHLATLKVFMEFFVNAVELIAFPGFFIIEVNLAFAVAVDAPSHAQV